MNGPPAPALRDLVQETQQLLDSGDVDGAVERRDILAAAIPSLPEGHLDRVRAQALAASLYLVLVQRAKAAEVLAPFIRDGVHAEEQPIRAIAERDPAIAAAIASAGADALFRMRSYDDADRLVKLALELIGTHHVSALGIEARHRAMLHLRTLARAGRIEWRTVAKGGPARSRLEACLRELDGYAARLTHEQASSVEAFVLDIWAAVDWSSGRHHEARGRIYRAITLLERPGMRDRSRLAHAYYIAGKIESSFVNESNYRTAVELLDRAIELFPRENTLRPQAWIQKAETLTKANLYSEAQHVLDQIQSDVKDDVQRAEALLCQVWISRLPPRWGDAERDARKILELSEKIEMPRRLVTEGQLQLGSALIRRGAPASRAEGLEALRSALANAQMYDRIKLRIAACFELANAYATTDEDIAAKFLDEGTSLLYRTHSAYLSRLRDEIASTLRHRWAFPVESWDYHLETKRFAHEFVRRLVAKHRGDQADAAREGGLDKTGIRRWLAWTEESELAKRRLQAVPRRRTTRAATRRRRRRRKS